MNLQSCTTCQAQLDDASIKAGRCPVCGAPTVATTLHTVQDLSQPGTSVTQDPSGSSTSEDSSERSLEHPRKDSSLSGQTTNPNHATVDLSPADTAADLGPLMGSQDGTASANSNEDKPAENETDAEPSKKSTHLIDTDMTIDIAELASESGEFKVSTDGVVRDERVTMDGDIENLDTQWQNSYDAATSNRNTIRQPDTKSGFRSSLPIKSRNVLESSSRTSGDPKQLPPAEVPDYELLNVIGEGGMGVVFSATQSSIARTVAVKMLKSNKQTNEEQHDKFISEAVVTGELDHPNIVPIYDLGTNESGALFYSMKHVRGTPWDDVIKDKSLDENLNILLRVADAVAFAHAHGVVHRDLKPENVMLGDYGEVLVMDWGLAQVTNDFANIEAIYQTGSLGGTPAYMSPEMARGPIEAIDFRSDVYLLGAILYEIIGGRPPHSGRDVMQCLMAATQNQIDPIEYEGELKSISMRAMAVNREDRYASIKDLQDAIGAYQSHSESLMLTASSRHHLEKARQTSNYDTYARSVFGFQEALQLWDGNEKARIALVEAQFDYASCAYDKGDFDLAATLLNPANETHTELLSKIEQGQQERDARQWRLRNFRRIVAALVVAIAGISILAAVLINQNRQEAVHQKSIAEKSEQEAVHQKSIAEKNEQEAVRQKTLADKAKEAEEYESYIARIGLAAAKIDENAYDYAYELLTQCRQDLRHWEWGRLAHLCQLSELPMQANGPVDAVAYSPLGDQCVSGDWDGQVAIRDISDGKVIHSLQHGQYVHAVAYSPSGKFIASGSSDSTIRLIDARTGLEIRKLPGKAQGVGHQDAVLSLQFSPDGKQLITTSYDESARLWDLQSGSELQVLRGHSWWVWDAEFSPDGKQLVTVGQDGRAIIWKRAINQDNTFGPFEKITEFPGHEGPVYTADFSNDGQLVATGGYDNKVLVWNPNEVQPIDIGRRIENLPDPKPTHLELSGHNGPVRSVAFSPTNSTLLVSGSHDNTLQIWNVATGNLVKIFRGHGGSVRSCAFSPDGLKVLSGAHDEFVRLWNIEGYQEKRVIRGRVLKGHTDAVLSAQFSPDGANIVTASRDRTASLWDVATGKQIREFNEGHQFLASNIAFFDNGRKLVTGGGDNSVRIWDVITGTQLLPISPTGRMGTIAISPDGSQIVTGSAGNEIQVW
ncbi:MAG: protein kinase, partial [Pirellulaceae bacterium]|nr:protein kinase [Pirellulaceae bacterium]